MFYQWVHINTTISGWNSFPVHSSLNIDQESTYVVLRLVDADEEEELGDEEVDAQVLVYGVAVGLQASQEAEGGDADGETHQRNDDTHPCDHKEDQLVHPAWILRETERWIGEMV